MRKPPNLMATLVAIVLVAGFGCGDNGNGNGNGNGEPERNPLNIEIQEATVPASGAPTVRFRLTDGDGNPITDLETEINNEQAGGQPAAEPRMRPRFSIAQREESGTFTHLLERVVDGADFGSESPALASALQPTTEPESPFPMGRLDQSRASEGVYTYTFREPTTLAAKLDRSLTHRVGIWATRTAGGRPFSAVAVRDFNPTGGTVQSMETVTTGACNNCHGDIRAHDNRRDIRLCVTCHASDRQDEYLDPETGNDISGRVMFHKIHRGANLPSVIEGTPYRIVGFRQSVHDYSNIHFPRPITDCEACHNGPQGDRWKTAPGVEACTSCHDNVLFDASAGAVCQPDDTVPCNHPAGPLPGAANCTQCHTAQSIESNHGG